MRKLAHWLEEYEVSESVDLLRTIALSHAELGGQIGREIAQAIRADDLKTLCEFSLDYEDLRFENVEQIAQCRQALAFFTKLEHLELKGIDPREAALRKWWEAEARCRETNALFRMRARGEFQFSSRVESIFYRARRKIARVLGRIPKFDELQYRFGPGATVATKKKDANPREKIQARVQCSEDFFPIAKAVLEEMPHLAQLHSVLDRTDEDGEEWLSIPVDIVYGRLDFVAKNAKTKRITVIEPSLNSMFQLAVGDHLFRRLAAFGLNLRDQTLNQCYAMCGSLSGDLATLDLKSASDTIAKELVFELLPLDWAVFLARGRSSKITLPSGELVTQEKFSSMGNGFTFPLESLIFWALVESACDPGDIVNVFGDDIICPTRHANLVIEVLNAAGFWVNLEKSYWSGPFRESCGMDFYRGVNVRPFYQKDWVSGRTLFLLHNHYARIGDCKHRDLVLSWIHPSLRIYGPDGYGDGHLLGDYIPLKKKNQTDNGYAGHLFSTFTVKSRRDIRPKQKGDFVLPHYSIYRRGSTTILDWASLLENGKPTRLPILSDRYRPSSLLVEEPSAVIPETTLDDGVLVKALACPGENGYKKISIYTLG